MPTKASIKRVLNSKGNQTKKVNTLLNMGYDVFNSLNANEMRKVIKKLMPEVKRRIREFGKDSSPALGRYLRSGDDINLEHGNLNQYRNDYMRIKNFLDSQTSEKAKWEKTKKSIIDGMKERGVELTPENFESVWKAYDLLTELDKKVTNREFKYMVLHRIVELQDEKNYTEDQIAVKIKKDFNQIYEDYMAGLDDEEDYEEGGEYELY